MTTGIEAPRPRPSQKRRTAIIVSFAASAVILMVVAAYWNGYRINLTPSEPLGLWRIVALDRAASAGDLIFICPPKTAAMKEAKARGYLRSGSCQGGVAPLIKTVIAVGGQHVEIGPDVSIDGSAVPSSDLAQRDGKGRPMAPFPGGIVPTGSVFLHSPFRSSYDSRYFGPLPASGVLGLAQEVLTYAP
jgi:conjugative transfer signal peptidase TraF